MKEKVKINTKLKKFYNTSDVIQTRKIFAEKLKKSEMSHQSGNISV